MRKYSSKYVWNSLLLNVFLVFYAISFPIVWNMLTQFLANAGVNE